MAFESIIGQNDIKRRLSESAMQDKVGHAYLFGGAKGIGKKTFAKEFSKMCMCTNPKEDGSACQKCQSCVLIDAGTNSDFVIVEPRDDKKNITVDQVREEIQDATLKAPLFSRRKVFIINGADKMNEQAQNALLKTLEEPPEFVMIMLLAENNISLLDTIKSRVVRIDIKRNSDSEIIKRCDEICTSNAPVNKELLVAYADGIMGRVEEFLLDEQVMTTRKEMIRNLLSCFKGDFEARKSLLQMVDLKTKKYEFFFFSMMSFLRDAMVLAKLGSKAKIMNSDYKRELLEIADIADYYKLKKALAATSECYTKLLQNGMAELAVTDMLVKLT